jgi:hypothetical protein
MPDSREKRHLKKDKWPSGRVDEWHLFQCPLCHEWAETKPSIIKRPAFCPRCKCFMQPRGLKHVER